MATLPLMQEIIKSVNVKGGRNVLDLGFFKELTWSADLVEEIQDDENTIVKVFAVLYHGSKKYDQVHLLTGTRELYRKNSVELLKAAKQWCEESVYK